MNKMFNLISKMALSLAIVSTVAGCSYELENEETAKQEQAVLTACNIIIDNVDWDPTSSTTGSVVYSVQNTGALPCSYQIQTRVVKNGVVTNGPVRGPYSLSPTPSVSPVRRDNYNIGANPFGSCRFTVLVKYKATPVSPDVWRDLIPPTPSDPNSGVVCS